MRRSLILSVCAGFACLVTLTGCPRFETDPPPEGATEMSRESPPEKVAPGPVDEGAAEEFTETESGLKYRIRREGEGERPKRSDRVTVHYKGWLDDGTIFDSSYRRGEPASFGLSQVIPGWTEGLQHVREGGMIELEIPPEMGYGERGAGADIPPGATLHFLVELIEIE